MTDNLQVKDATGTTKTVRTTDNAGVHVPHHRIADGTNITGSTGAALNTDLLTGSVNGWYDAGIFFSGAIQVIASAGISAGAIIFEQTNDNTSTVGIPLPAFEASVLNANPIVSAVNIAAGSRRMWLVPITAKYIRVRISTAFVGGTVQAIANFSQQTFANPVMNVQQATAAYFNVTAVQSNAANLKVQNTLSDSTTLAGPSSQSAINTDLLTGTVSGWYDAAAFQSAAVQIIASAGITAGAVIFEQTNDTTNASAGVPAPAYEASSIAANPNVAAITIAANSNRVFNVAITARYFRVRISTAFVGGSVAAVAQFSQQPYAAPVANVQQAAAANLNTTTTISGTPSVLPTNNIFYNESSTAQAASATVTGTSRDQGVAAAAATKYGAFNAFAFADVAGTMRIECSNDNTTWRRATVDTAVAANTPVHLSVPATTRYYRAVYVNGASAQTAFMLNTSFSAS